MTDRHRRRSRIVSLAGASACALVFGWTVASVPPARAQFSGGKKIVEDMKKAVGDCENAALPGDDSDGPAGPAATGRKGATAGGRTATGGAGPDSGGASVGPRTVDSGGGIFTPTGNGDASDSGEVGDEGGAEGPRAASVPELHPVQKGDTLWSMCKYYFGDPWQWPQLWSLNPLVTNPHWIFPGDVVRLRMPEGEESPSAALEPQSAAGPRIQSRASGGGGDAVVLRDMGFVESADMRAAGRITGSREEKILLATGDAAYVSFKKEKPLRAGERYTIFEVNTQHPVVDPKTEVQLGYMVRILGDIVIDQIADETTGRGTLYDMVEPVERGFFISNQVKQFRRVQPRASQVTIESRVIASFSPINLLANSNFVVLSSGSKDGLEVGNRSYVIRRGDGYSRLMQGWEAFDNNYPKEVVAELLVVDVRDNTSVAWISRTTKELRVGETTETRKGY